MKKSEIIKTIKHLKSKPFGSIVLKGKISKTNFKLILITNDCEKDQKIIAHLSSWRKKYEQWFQAQFPVSNQRTQKWLKKQVLDSPDRLLFMIQANKKYVGHAGLYRFNFQKNTCEIDNVVHGNPIYKGIMTKSLQILMYWGKNNLKLSSYTLQTTSDNQKALNLYHRLHFYPWKKIPLIHQKTHEGKEWVQAKAGYKKPIKRYEVFMKLK